MWFDEIVFEIFLHGIAVIIPRPCDNYWALRVVSLLDILNVCSILTNSVVLTHLAADWSSLYNDNIATDMLTVDKNKQKLLIRYRGNPTARFQGDKI